MSSIYHHHQTCKFGQQHQSILLITGSVYNFSHFQASRLTKSNQESQSWDQT